MLVHIPGHSVNYSDIIHDSKHLGLLGLKKNPEQCDAFYGVLIAELLVLIEAMIFYTNKPFLIWISDRSSIA